MTSTPNPAAARRRRPKLDPQLAEEVELARAALTEIAADDQVGEHVGAAADDDRLVTHRFQCLLPGYKGWHWFSTLARASRSKSVTVCELGLVSGEDSLLSPPWVPWAERVKPEERAEEEAAEKAAAGTSETAETVAESADEPAGGAVKEDGDETTSEDKADAED